MGVSVVKVGRWVRVLERVFGLGSQVQEREKWRMLMAAIDNLEAAVALNTAKVDQAIAKIDELKQGGVDEVRVQAAADQVAADAARLDSASNS